MYRPFCRPLYFLVALLCAPSFAQESAKTNGTSQDFLKEGVVIERLTSTVMFQSDGTSTREQKARVRVQSDAGVRQYGVLRIPYQASVERVEVLEVRVTNPSGLAVASPLDSIQDVTSEVSRDAPLYSDLHEKHVPVKGLEPGDTLEYAVRWQVENPLAPGQFWFSHPFTKGAIVLDEELEINVPRAREVKLKSQSVKPVVRDQGDRRYYSWKTSNLEVESTDKQKERYGYDAARGLLPPADVLISSFRTWEELGRWYDGLQREKIQPSPEVKAKAEELTKGLTEDEAKIRAIYSYVSLRYRYVSVAFGIGRYQPHAAREILDNQYGDCKDKHTLLAALLAAVGIRAFPALINSRTAIDTDVPSPGQFNHVISTAVVGDVSSWMDTTTEVAAVGQLPYPLRGKPALVIATDKVAFQTTPQVLPFASSFAVTLMASLDADGTLHAQAKLVTRGDDELYSRYSFRRVPESQWRDLIQQSSYAARLGATIGHVRASSPEKTDEPFVEEYDYTLKDFSGGDKHRFVIPSAVGIVAVKDEDLTRTTPLWLGYAGEQHYEARIELPKGWSATTPASLDLKESFAEFQGSSEVKEGVLIIRRRLLIKADSIKPDQMKSYKTFQKAIADHYATYIYLISQSAASAPTLKSPALTPAQNLSAAGDLVREIFRQLPNSSSPEALQEEKSALKLAHAKDYKAAIESLKHATSLDPAFSRAWIELAACYYSNQDVNLAIKSYKQAVEADAKQILPYKVLAFVYAGMGRQDDAIATWKRLQIIAPEDHDIAPRLVELYLAQKRYADATELMESEVKLNPSDAYARWKLGSIQLRANQTAQGIEEMHKALEMDSSAEMLNEVAYELAEADTNLSDALRYSQQSIKEVEGISRKADIANVQKAELRVSSNLSADWDTIGWIYFKMGDLARAENYIKAAWQLSQDGVVGDHLGQIYEKERKLPDALHTYNLALEASPGLEATRSRVSGLSKIHPSEKIMSAGEELRQMRTFKLPTITKETASADFYVLLGAGGKIEKSSFAQGSDLLRNAADSLEKIPIQTMFPTGSEVRILRKATVSCSPYTGCSFVFYPLSETASAN